jgi:uracil-DNA glycosylase family 4
VLLLGEAPGELEDRNGEPFVGRSGRVLDETLAELGVKRADVYVCNAVKCRPPANRTPEHGEITACSSFLERQLALVAPRVVVALGASAARALGVEFKSLGSVRGVALTVPASSFVDRALPLVVTYHPAYVLRNRPRHGAVLRADLETAFKIASRVQTE